MILSIAKLIIGFVIPFLTGFFAVSLLDRELALRFRILISIPLGFGVHSILYFIYQQLNIYNFQNFQIFEAILVLILALFYYNQERPNFSKHKFKKLNNWFYLANLYGLCMFLKYFINNPMGSWDGFRIWNIKAEYLFLQSPEWKNVFSLPHFMMHSDYPMFLPSTTARLWNWYGEQSFYINIILGAIFTFGLTYLLYQCIRYFKSEKVANIVCIIFLLSDIVMVNGAAQCADIPIAFYFLSAIICLFFYFKTNRTSMAILGILLAGLSIWVKNEGMMFFIVYIGTILSYFIFSKKTKLLLYSLLCSIPIIVLSMLYKKYTNTPNDLVYGLIIAKSYKFALEPNRYLVVLATFIDMLFKRFYIFLPLAILCLKGLKIKKSIEVPYILSTIIFVGCVLGYITVYIIAPHDITWLVENSMERIILQILPIFLLLISLSMRIGKPDTAN